MAAVTISHSRSEQRPKVFVPNKEVEKTFLISTLAFTALSLIPPLRFAGSMGLRIVAFLSSFNLCAENWDRSSNLDKMLLVSKVSLVALGALGVLVSSPLLIVGSLAADTALQLKALICALHEGKKDQALIHLGVLIINALVIAALLTGSWQFVVIASALTAILMFGVALKLVIKEDRDWTEVLSYVALALAGIAGSVSMAQILNDTPIKSTFDIHNTTQYNYYVYDRCGNVIATIAPGESAHLEVPHDQLFHIPKTYSSVDSVLKIHTPDAPDHQWNYSWPDTTEYGVEVIKQPIAPSEIPYAPLGSTMVVTKELT